MKEISETCFIAQEDVKDFFYRISILDLPELCRYFGLPEVHTLTLMQGFRARGLGVPSELFGYLDGPGTCHPRLSVLAMGWTWAFFLSQRVHETTCSEAVPEAGQAAVSSTVAQ